MAERTSKRSPWRWAIPGSIAGVVLVGLMASLGGAGGSANEGDRGGTPPVSTPPSTPDTSPPPAPPTAMDALLSTVPAAFGGCQQSPGEPVGLDGEVVPGSTAMVQCATTYDAGDGQAQPVTGWFTLFEPATGAHAYFDADVPTDILNTVGACPTTLGTSIYRIGDATAGDVACFTATYDTGQHPTITWTRDTSGVVGELIGPAGGDLAALWEFWLTSAQIGEL